MKYSIELIINKNRNEVWKNFDNVENLYKWMPTLKEFNHESGEAGKPGAKSRLKFLEGKRDIEMIETIIERNEPEEFSGTYEMKGTRNLIKNSFRELSDNRTIWKLDSEFEFSGIYKLMSPLFKTMIVKRTQSNMNRFKELVERNLE